MDQLNVNKLNKSNAPRRSLRTAFHNDINKTVLWDLQN